jgi:predicted phage terminase large subunit-like protein
MRAHHLSGEPADLVNQPTYITWDCSSGHATGDFSCGAVGKISERGELYVVDLDYGKWKQSELAIHIVKLAAKHRPQFIVIEDFAWSELLKKEINFHAQYMGVTLPIYWKKTDKSMNAKKNRIKGLEGLLAEDRLFFVSGFYTDELMKQFTRFTGERKIRNRHDDIPDAISYLQQFVPDMVTGEVDAPIVDPTLQQIAEMGRALAPDRKQFEQQRVAKPMHRMAEMSPMLNPNFADEWNNRNAGTKNAFGLSQPEPVVEEVSSGNPIDDAYFGGQGIYR